MRLLPALALLSACQSWTLYEEDGLSGAEQDRTTGRGGTTVFRIPVEAGDTHLLFTVTTEFPNEVYVASLEDPNGVEIYNAEDVWNGPPNSLTAAIAPEGAVSLNWPILDSHDDLFEGEYRATVGVIEPIDNFFVRGADVTGHVLLKQDGTPNGGTLHVNVLYAAGTQNDDGYVTAVEGAVDVWADMYSAVGVELVVSYFETNVDLLRAPGDGTRDEYLAISESTALNSINVVIIDTITDAPGLYGLAGGIPGALVATGQSAVTVSMLVNAGADGIFSAQDTRLLGESMAHEALHYLGVFHPVEVGPVGGPNYSAWDSLDDTPECASEAACFDLLGDNLMFPFPICETDGSCRPQFELTGDQDTLANRYVGVD